MSESKSHKICTQCQQVRPLAEFGDDAFNALVNILDRYTSLVNCGDCGNWNPEEEKEVIAARNAIRNNDKSSRNQVVDLILGDFSFTRDISGKRIIVGQPDGSGVAAEDSETNSIASCMLYRLADHIIKAIEELKQ